MKRTLLIATATSVLTLAGVGGASAQSYVVEDAPPVYEVAPPAVVTAAPVYVAPAPFYDAAVIPYDAAVIPARPAPEVVVTEPTWDSGPGVVHADW